MAQSGVKAGDSDKGEAVYQKRCLQCHGVEGDGLGPAAERLNPPPRDFTLGLYKIKSSAFDADLPNDEDLFRMVRDGMPGTAMPGWGDMLSDQDMWDVITYIKSFAELEGQPEKQVEYQPQGGTVIEPFSETSAALRWTPEAEEWLARIPAFVRRFVRQKAEEHVRANNGHEVTDAVMSALAKTASRRLGGRGSMAPGPAP